MSFRTVSDGSHLLKASPATEILLMCDSLKVFWIHTGAISTQMIQLKTVRYGAIHRFIGKPVNPHDTPVDANLAVSVRGCPCPDKTIATGLHLGPEALGK